MNNGKVSPEPRAHESIGVAGEGPKQDKVFNDRPLVLPLQAVQATEVRQLAEILVGGAVHGRGVSQREVEVVYKALQKLAILWAICVAWRRCSN